MYIVMSVTTNTPPGVKQFWEEYPDTMKKINNIMKEVPGVAKILREPKGDRDAIVHVYFESYEYLNDWVDRVWSIPEFIQRYDYNVTHGISRASVISEAAVIPDDPKYFVIK